MATSSNTNSPDRPRPVAAARPRLPWWKKALFSLITCGGLLTIFEGALALIGFAPLLPNSDPYIALETPRRVFRPRLVSGKSVRLVTAPEKLRYFNRQSFLQDKAAGTYRIVCLGGSTTFGRPYDDATSFAGWLRVLLPEIEPGIRWEVINAGGISYASYRVAAVVQEIIRYEPDLCIVYTGHNEFLEARTYAAAFDMPPSLRFAAATLGRTRAYAALAGLLRSETPPTPANTPSLPAEVQPILDNSLGPEDFNRADLQRRQVAQHFRFNLRRIIATAGSVGCEVLLMTPASNLRDCSPFKSEHAKELMADERRTIRARLAAAERFYSEQRYGAALAQCNEAIALDPQYAKSYYLRGRANDALGRHDAARRDYLRARDEDICPLRATSALVRSVVKIGRDKQVPVVDSARLLANASSDGITDRQIFIDHVHPTIAGNRLLALELINMLRKQEILGEATDSEAAVIAGVTRRMEGKTKPARRVTALRTVAQVMWWAGKADEAYHAACRAKTIAPGRGEADFLAGYFAEHMGRTEAALEHYSELGQKSPTGEPPAYWTRGICRYGRLLAKRGQWEPARTELQRILDHFPTHAEAKDELYQVLLSQSARLIESGAVPRAIAALEQAKRLFPTRPAPRTRLAAALAEAGRLERAIVELRRVIALAPDQITAYRRLGSLLIDTGQTEAARDAFHQVLARAPNDPIAQQQLALIANRAASSNHNNDSSGD